ncbi:(2Fe-2S)-binding protein [Streptomyces deserti]
MTDDQHGEGTPQGGGRWDPLPQGDYDDGATAFVQLPEGGVDALLAGADSPLAAPGHGYVPPQITVAPATTAGTDPAATGTWAVPGAPVDGAQWHDPHAGHHQHGGDLSHLQHGDDPSHHQHGGEAGHHQHGGEAGHHQHDPGAGSQYHDTNAGAQQHTPHDRFAYHPGATGQWNFEETQAAEAASAAPGHDVTGQWSIPVAGGDLPDESGEFTTSALVEQWGGTPPATLPGGASAPWATQSVGQPWGPMAPPEQAGAGHPPQQTGAGHGHDQAGAAGQAPEQPAGHPHGEPVPDGPAAQQPSAEQPSAGHAPEASGDPGHAPEESGDPGHAPEESGVSGHAPEQSASADHQSRTEPYEATAPHAGTEPVEQAAAETPAESAPEAPQPAQDASQSAPGRGEANEAAEDAQRAPAAADGPAEPHGDSVPDAATDAEPGPEAADAERPDAPDAPENAQGPAQEATDAPDAPDAGDASDAQATAAHDSAAPPQDPPPAPPREEHPLASYVLRVNGTDRPVTDAWIGESLLYVLRERLGLAGAKDGCSQGECGACNVQVDGRLVASCLVPAATAAGSEVRTVEGLAVDGQPSDVQRALARCGAVQCGFCVPGMAMTVHDLLEGNPAPTELETRQALCGNLCRCSGYRGVVRAVQEVVAEREAHTTADDAEPDADEPRIPHQAGPGAGGIHPEGFSPPGPHDQPYGQDGGHA